MHCEDFSDLQASQGAPMQSDEMNIYHDNLFASRHRDTRSASAMPGQEGLTRRGGPDPLATLRSAGRAHAASGQTLPALNHFVFFSARNGGLGSIANKIETASHVQFSISTLLNSRSISTLLNSQLNA